MEVSKVKAPPAPSVVTADRGFALLRADESPTYWESPKPAVSLQFGMYYVHYVHDCFSLLQYVAHNRYIYNKMGATQGNYAGGDPWRDHVRGQGSGVVVDGQRVQPVDRGDNGCEHQRIRQQLSPLAKFVAVRATMRHGEAPKNGPDTTFPINQERALVLTDDYLFDLFTLADPADKPHVYDWHVLAPATLEADAKWLPVEKLEKVRDQDLKKPYLSDLLVQDVGDKPWQVTLDQTAGGVAGGAAIPAGVNVWMLPAPGTALVAGRPPGLGDPNAGFKGAGASNRGVQLIATRTAPRTTFVALHDPYLGEGRVTGFAAVAQTDHGVAAAVTGKDGLNDRIIVCTGEKVDQPETFAGNGESFTATGYAFVRIRPEKVEVFGGLTAMKLKVTGHPTLEVNGKKADARVNGGVLEFSGR